jgi:hypothetical protein
MDADDRFEEIKRLLNSTISEFQSLFQSAGGFEDSRVGNGWDPSSIKIDICCLTPKPLDELIKLADIRKRSLYRNRLFAFMKPREHDVRIMGDPKVRLIPFWMIKGFHECFYFRGSSYTIDVQDDVVAVDLEGKIRELVSQDSGEFAQLTNLPRRLLGMRRRTGEKSIRLNDVTELAYSYKEGSIFLDAEGREDLEAEAFFEGRIPLQRLREEDLSKQFPSSEVGASSVTKEELIRRLHAMIVKPPVAFSKILSNRFQVTDLVQYLVPVYSFDFDWRGQRRSLRLHGFTGAVF